MEIEFNEEDKFIILDSDGIWEFISNQEVVDIIKIII
jgi:serine/threonine protein phosphatase PrpC